MPYGRQGNVDDAYRRYCRLFYRYTCYFMALKRDISRNTGGKVKKPK
jgi:hypothetical protein